MKGVAVPLIVLGLFSRRKKETPPASEDKGAFIRCPACRKELHSTIPRCPYCSAFLEINCPNCDRTTSRSLSNCPYCGTSLEDRTH
ncbi:MAG: zinc ribbon domain-containing protein [Methanomassiliicoccus sp.]|nr:zinc ribbon domain-containing protein [Methanomassiliicoccus sp.]